MAPEAAGTQASRPVQGMQGGRPQVRREAAPRERGGDLDGDVELAQTNREISAKRLSLAPGTLAEGGCSLQTNIREYMYAYMNLIHVYKCMHVYTHRCIHTPFCIRSL